MDEEQKGRKEEERRCHDNERHPHRKKDQDRRPFPSK